MNELISEEDRWGDNRHYWKSGFLKQYVKKVEKAAPSGKIAHQLSFWISMRAHGTTNKICTTTSRISVELDFDDREGKQLRALVASFQEDKIGGTSQDMPSDVLPSSAAEDDFGILMEEVIHYIAQLVSPEMLDRCNIKWFVMTYDHTSIFADLEEIGTSAKRESPRVLPRAEKAQFGEQTFEAAKR